MNYPWLKSQLCLKENNGSDVFYSYIFIKKYLIPYIIIYIMLHTVPQLFFMDIKAIHSNWISKVLWEWLVAGVTSGWQNFLKLPTTRQATLYNTKMCTIQCKIHQKEMRKWVTGKWRLHENQLRQNRAICTQFVPGGFLNRGWYKYQINFPLKK